MQRIENYWESSALSQSKIKAILKGTHLYRIIDEDPMYFKKKEGMLIGSITDDILSGFTDKYYIGLTQLSGVIPSILHMAFDSSPDKEYDEDLILKCAKYHKYGGDSYSDERILKEIEKKKDYWDELVKANGKIPISNEDWDRSIELAKSILNHEYTSWLFEVPHQFQTPLYFTIDGIECKALIDYLGFQDDLILIGDFKMTEYNSYFKDSFIRFGYGIQNVHYLKALEANFPDKSHSDFMFITESYKAPGLPLIYTVGDLAEHEKEWQKGFDLYRWHLENNIWDIDKDIYESKGKLVL